MTDTRDPRGIINFFVRYLVLHAVFLLGFTLSYFIEIALIYFFGFMGFFTFFQVLIAVTRKFLDKAGSWKPVAIAGALLSDVAVLWWLGGIVSGFFVDSNWELVTIWLPFHFVAAFSAWGLREIFHSPDPQRNATPSAPDIPTESATSENLGESSGTDAPAATPASAKADTDADNQ